MPIEGCLRRSARAREFEHLLRPRRERDVANGRSRRPAAGAAHAEPAAGLLLRRRANGSGPKFSSSRRRTSSRSIRSPRSASASRGSSLVRALDVPLYGGHGTPSTGSPARAAAPTSVVGRQQPATGARCRCGGAERAGLFLASTTRARACAVKRSNIRSSRMLLVAGLLADAQCVAISCHDQPWARALRTGAPRASRRAVKGDDRTQADRGSALAGLGRTGVALPCRQHTLTRIDCQPWLTSRLSDATVRPPTPTFRIGPATCAPAVATSRRADLVVHAGDWVGKRFWTGCSRVGPPVGVQATTTGRRCAPGCPRSPAPTRRPPLRGGARDRRRAAGRPLRRPFPGHRRAGLRSQPHPWDSTTPGGLRLLNRAHRPTGAANPVHTHMTPGHRRGTGRGAPD